MTKRRTYRVNADSWTVLRDILVGTPDEFNTDSATLRGRFPVAFDRFGRLPIEYHADLHDNARYIIWSYDTPIAYRRVADWNRNGTANYEWIIPDVRYSVTTSKHQGKVRTAISQISGGYNV